MNWATEYLDVYIYIDTHIITVSEINRTQLFLIEHPESNLDVQVLIGCRNVLLCTDHVLLRSHIRPARKAEVGISTPRSPKNCWLITFF